MSTLTQEQIAIIASTNTGSTNKVILGGVVRNRDEALAEIDAQIIENRGITYYDPQDDIESCIASGHVRARLRANIVWSIKARVAGAIRNVVYSMNEHARDTGHIDNLNEFCQSMADAHSSAEYAETLGYAHHGSGMARISALMHIARDWEEHAERDARANGIRYQTKELSTFLVDKPVFDGESLAKDLALQMFMLEAELERKPDAEEIESVTKLTTQAHQRRHESRLKAHGEILPLCMQVLTEAQSRYVESVGFWDLPIDDQRALIEAVQRSAPKVPAQLTGDRKVTIVELTMGYTAMKRLGARLIEVLDNSKFAE